MSILGFPTPSFITLTRDGVDLALDLNADQRSEYERFCNDLLQRVSVSVFEALCKANDYIVHGLNGVDLRSWETSDNQWGQTYHDLVSVFGTEHIERLRPATQYEVDFWKLRL